VGKRKTWRRCWEVGALARASAKGSQLWDSIPPLGSAILTPLSETLLCEAVSITPITDPSIFSDLSAARIPTLYTVDSSSAASALNPAVPYDNLTPAQKHTYIYHHHFFFFFVENREREMEKGKEEPLGGGKREEELRRRERWSSFMVDDQQWWWWWILSLISTATHWSFLGNVHLM
jgi:hypothetical protein